MNYPFLYKILDNIDPREIRENLIKSNEKETVWDDWCLISAESTTIRKYLSSKVPHLKLFRDKIYISEGTNSNFHYDRFKVYHLMHRFLIPLDDNFQYEWMSGDEKKTYQPKAGEVILFNNMVPHRFVSFSKQKREVVYMDLFDPLVEEMLATIKGNYSELNAQLEKKYS